MRRRSVHKMHVDNMFEPLDLRHLRSFASTHLCMSLSQSYEYSTFTKILPLISYSTVCCASVTLSTFYSSLFVLSTFSSFSISLHYFSLFLLPTFHPLLTKLHPFFSFFFHLSPPPSPFPHTSLQQTSLNSLQMPAIDSGSGYGR